MKLKAVSFIVIFSFLTLAGVIDNTYFLISGKAAFSERVQEYLVTISNIDSERVEDFIFEMESDILLLSFNNKKVKDVLSSELGYREEAIRVDVDRRMGIISKDIENYIKLHTEMTLEDLQNSEEFQDIAVQGVGVDGYSMIYDAETEVILFHKSPVFIGMSGDEFAQDSPRIIELVDKVSAEDISFGFYNWRDPDGIIRKKYVQFRKIPVRTADGINFVAGVTVYIDEYKIAKNVSRDSINYFNFLIELKDYHDILILSPNNEVIYMTRIIEGLGTSIKNIRRDFFDMDSIIGELGKGDIGYFGPFVGDDGKDDLKIALISKFYDVDKFLGTVVIIKDMDEINNILEQGASLSSRVGDESYMINSDGFLITPLKSRSVDLMVQEIKTESARECLDYFKEAESIGINIKEYRLLIETFDFVEFLDYKGDYSFGLHSPIESMKWCSLTEINVDEVLNEPMKKGFSRIVYFKAGIFVLLTILLSLFIIFSPDYDLKMKSKYRRVLSRKNKVVFGLFSCLEFGCFVLFLGVLALIFCIFVSIFNFESSHIICSIGIAILFFILIMIPLINNFLKKRKKR